MKWCYGGYDEYGRCKSTGSGCTLMFVLPFVALLVAKIIL